MGLWVLSKHPSSPGPPSPEAPRWQSWLRATSLRRVERRGGELIARLRGAGRRDRLRRAHLVKVRVERFRHADGEVVEREIVRHQGAVGIVAYDSEPGVARASAARGGRMSLTCLEIPAGRLDVEGETPRQAAQRELAEEIGLGARRLEPILTYYTGAGFTDERVHRFAATDLFEASAESEENERIEIVGWQLEEIERLIEKCEDAKTLIGLMWLSRSLNAGLHLKGGAGAEAKPGG